MEKKLWRFINSQGSFISEGADKIKTLYFPLANERLISSISPELRGDTKSGHNAFLTPPVSRIDLVNSKASRNFWLHLGKDKIWSASGVSKDLKQIQEDDFSLNAGLLWHKVKRSNKRIGLSAEILSFIPSSGEPLEVMQVTLTNITPRKIEFTPIAAIPIYARSANNLRDHRHVTSLLQRITKHKFGVISQPTLVFDEKGHRRNEDIYFVLGWDQQKQPPRYLYPTQEMFCGEAGDLEAPISVLKNELPGKTQIQGREPMGGLRFSRRVLQSGQSWTYTIVMGITNAELPIASIIRRFQGPKQIKDSFNRTKSDWEKIAQEASLSTGDSDFDNWFRWVSIQPKLRSIFGCSFLPDFDYGKGGRGWRDLWQDCLGLILNNPRQIRQQIINNFSGVRIDGSNATIIGKKPGEFISDRNNISRVWMDHGVWPLLTLDLYLNETGDFNILLSKSAYFRNHQLCRCRESDPNWNPAQGIKLKTASGKVYYGTLLEHLLVENLVQFFNVGSHNHTRLEGADWNDGLDMASENGESVAFSAMYAHNLRLLSALLEKLKVKKIRVAKEISILLGKVDYNDLESKQALLNKYFRQTKYVLSGKIVDLDKDRLARNLKSKSEWVGRHIRTKEWLKQGFFNGYYDNQKKRLEGYRRKGMRICLASQVFPIMSGVAQKSQITRIWGSIQRYLFDQKLKGYHLNTDFKEEQLYLGRAFSFIYGDKENGAFFNHMVVMLAYALYKQGYAQEGWCVLNSIYKMAMDTSRSKIYPCLPEYFNLQGRGMYAYLTGSASWFILTVLTQAFGARGQDGDLLVEPKLSIEQFKASDRISLSRIFAGRHLKINFSNPFKASPEKYRIIKASLNARPLKVSNSPYLIIRRHNFLRLPKGKLNTLDIVLS
ncbi:cellobiose phosphorylase [bacterium]|nr:MAG: cellobiose phosphorylase [bacterium]